MAEQKIPRLFTKMIGSTRVQNVHIFQNGHPEIERMLNFRDYLQAHPIEAEIYCRLKENLAQQYPKDIDRYIEGKSEFIAEMIGRAKVWRESLER